MGLLYIVFSPNMLHFTRISEKQVEQKNQQKMTSKRGSQPGRPQVELSSLDHSNKRTLGQTQHNSEESVDTHDSLAGRGRDVIRSCETAASRRSRSAARGSGTCAVKKKKRCHVWRTLATVLWALLLPSDGSDCSGRSRRRATSPARSSRRRRLPCVKSFHFLFQFCLYSLSTVR